MCSKAFRFKGVPYRLEKYGKYYTYLLFPVLRSILVPSQVTAMPVVHFLRFKSTLAERDMMSKAVHFSPDGPITPTYSQPFKNADVRDDLSV